MQRHRGLIKRGGSACGVGWQEGGLCEEEPAKQQLFPGGNREPWMVFEQRGVHFSQMTPVLTHTTDMGAVLEEGRLEAGDKQGAL